MSVTTLKEYYHPSIYLKVIEIIIMKTPVIGFIGAGNMASSLIGGLITDGWSPDCIRAADPDATRRETIRSQFAIHSSEDNASIAMEADVLVLAVKPQALQQVATELSNTVQQQKPLVISIAAGVREPDINRWLGGSIAIVRSMPNTPAMVQSGATAMIEPNNFTLATRLADINSYARTVTRCWWPHWPQG